MTTDTPPTEQAPTAEPTPQAKPAPKPKATETAAKRASTRRTPSRPRAKKTYDQGYRSTNRVWPD